MLALLMSAIVLCGLFSPVVVNAKAEDVYADELKEFFDEDTHSQLLEQTDAVYMEYAELLRTERNANIAMNVLGLIYGTGSEPCKNDYIQSLINIIRTYEDENAASMTQQNQLDDTKKLKDYLHDVVDIEMSWLGVIGAAKAMGEDAKIALSVINEMMKDEDDWIKSVGALKTMLQNYEKHDSFLQLVETKADGILKEAAGELRTALSEVMKVRLRAYAELTKNSAEDYAKLFVDEIFADEWKEYLKGKIKFDISFLDALPAAKLGVDIGKLLGNLTVGAEDVITYVLEIKAVHDISVILEKELGYIKNSVQKDAAKIAETTAQNYMAYGNYLISCRIRGQYCMTAIYMQCPSLRTLLGEEAAQNAEAVYNRLTSNLLSVKKKLDAIKNSNVSLTLILSNIAADSIKYYNSTVGYNFAVIENNGKYGLIDYNGQIVLPIVYESIDLCEASPSGQETILLAYDSNYNSFLVEKDGSLTPKFFGGWGFERFATIYIMQGRPVMFDTDEGQVEYSYDAYTSYRHGACTLGTFTNETADVIPVQQIDGYRSCKGEMPAYEVSLVSEKYALFHLKTGELITDFIFDDYGANGFIEGILPVKKDGKWGYIDESGNMITDFIYDTSEVTPWVNNYMYSSLNNYIIVRQGDLWGLIDIQGNIVIEITYDGISQVTPDGYVWVKEDNSWSLWKITN